jgi:hypothetical protein
MSSCMSKAVCEPETLNSRFDRYHNSDGDGSVEEQPASFDRIGGPFRWTLRSVGALSAGGVPHIFMTLATTIER